MPTFRELMNLARKRNRSEATSARFKEILSIVKKHDVRSGLSPQGAVELLEDLGPTFVKLGQIASTHPDVLPREYCDAFGELRANVAPMDIATVRAQVEREIGRPLEEVFSEFDERAVGSASIAQVHRAKLKAGGEDVAVKVQRPGIVETVTNDLAIMERITELYDMLPGEGKLSLKELVDELASTSKDELDFHVEARNLEQFWENNEGRPRVTSPRCYEDYTTNGVLVEDYFDAPRIGEIDSIEGLTAEDREDLAYLIANNYVDQMLVDGFFHADPHAGNILVTPDKGIEWIDFGMMGTLTKHEREVVVEIVTALAKGDSYGLKRALLKVATPTGPVDHGALLDACERMTDEFIDVDLESFDTGALVNKMMDSLKETGFEVAPFLVTLGRGLVTLEGTIDLVSDKLNIMKVLERYLTRSFDPESVKRKARGLVGVGMDSVEATAGLPTKVSDTLDMLQKGQVKVGMNMEVTKSVEKRVRGTLNNFSFAIMAAALVLGSCVLCTTQLQPIVLGIPAIGFAGFVFGLLLMVYITWRIYKEGKR